MSQCQISLHQRTLISCSKAFGLVRRLVRWDCRWREELIASLPLTMITAIQLLPDQASVMKSGACLTLKVQVVSRP